MIQFIQNNAEIIVNLGVIISFIGSILLWSHRKLRADINEYKADIRADMNEYKTDMRVINTRIDATNARMDAMEQRIDHTYSLILDIMKEVKISLNRQS